jgi:hypothetical protein
MRSRIPDRLCAEAVEFAREAAVEAAGAAAVGAHEGAEADGDRVVTHYFTCTEAAYRGWRWAVTVARASRSRLVTLDETVLLPGPEALVAPEWLPWSERLRPGDLGPGDLLPTAEEDPRLESGWSGTDEIEPEQPESDAERAAVEASETYVPEGISLEHDRPGRDQPEAPAEQAGDEEITPAPTRATIGALAQELGFGRARVLSRYGLQLAADRWEKTYGAHTPMAQAAPASCATCGFLVPMAGLLRQQFGICANEFSPGDGRVVSLDYGCGAHSEAAVMPAAPRPAEPIVDEFLVEPMRLRPERGGGSVEESTPPEELGHS